MIYLDCACGLFVIQTKSIKKRVNAFGPVQINVPVIVNQFQIIWLVKIIREEEKRKDWQKTEKKILRDRD